MRRLIKNTAFLEFRIVRVPKGGGGVGEPRGSLAALGGTLPDDSRSWRGTSATARPARHRQALTTPSRSGARSPAATCSNARPGQGQFGEPIVEFSLQPRGRHAFGELTGQNIGSGLAIVLDGRVVSAPVVNVAHHRPRP